MTWSHNDDYQNSAFTRDDNIRLKMNSAKYTFDGGEDEEKVRQGAVISDAVSFMKRHTYAIYVLVMLMLVYFVNQANT